MNRITLALLMAAMVAAVCIPILAQQAPVEEKAEVAKVVPEYVGYKKCKPCHMKIYKAWEKTSHAKAFQTMIDSVGVDSNCVACHTVGYEQPGGFVDTSSTPLLTNVQCESCHGPGSIYKKLPMMKDREKALQNGMILPDEALCGKCHTEEQSPDFDYEEALKIGSHVAKAEE